MLDGYGDDAGYQIRPMVTVTRPVSVVKLVLKGYVIRVLYGPRQPRCRDLDQGNHVPVVYATPWRGSLHIRLTIRTPLRCQYFLTVDSPVRLSYENIRDRTDV